MAQGGFVGRRAVAAAGRAARTATSAASVVVLLAAIVAMMALSPVCAASAVRRRLPESSAEQIASVCECLLAPPGGPDPCVHCRAYANRTACDAADAAEACMWRDTEVQNRLAAHSREFDVPEVVTVAPGVHVALGYGLANVVLVEAADGAILIDAMESFEAGRALRAALDPILRAAGLAVTALVYTHAHTDHTYGARGMVTPEEQRTLQVYAHASLPAALRESSLVTPATWLRSQRQFGNFLPTGPDGHLNSGIGPALLYDNTTTPGYLRPTSLFDGDRLETRIAGEDVLLLHAPGESGDHTFVYLPNRRVGVAGDNLYRAFPNLYSIRGTRARPLMAWYASLDRIRDLPIATLVLGHTRPIRDAPDEVAATLTAYRDAIQYVHDATVRRLNRRWRVDQIAADVRLPAYLADDPHLQEFYGTVRWGVRAVVDYYLGWFDGRAAALDPLPLDRHSQRLVALAGGADAAAAAALVALQEGTPDGFQWALQLAEAVLELDPGHGPARTVAAGALRFLGFQQLSANARNYYLSEAVRIAGTPEPDPTLWQLGVSLAVLPIDNFFGQLPVQLNTERSRELALLAVALVVTDDRTYVVRVRREVAEMREYELAAPNYAPVNLTVAAAEATMKRLVAAPGQLGAELADGTVALQPPGDDGIALFELFVSLFQGNQAV